MPTFSIVIPTRARADTLQHALRTALAQTYSDLEIIVHESGADADTAAVLAREHDPRLRAYRTGHPVRMTENWERALDRAEGDYIYFMGDDDGLLPDACTIASHFLKSCDVEILSWRPASYLWPRFPIPDMRDRLLAVCDTRLTYTIKNTKTVLDLVYRFREEFSVLPMIYNNAIISRRLIDRVRQKRGRYFFGSSPDVISGVINAHFTDRFALCSRPLSIIGTSHNSTGYRSGRSQDEDSRREAVAAAFGTFVIHPRMVETLHLPLSVGNELLIAKDELFPHDLPDLNVAGMLQDAGSRINDSAGQYDTILHQCRAIAEKNGIVFDASHVPPPGPSPVPPRLARREIAPNVLAFDIDGRAHAVENVADASRVLHHAMPACSGATFEVVVEGEPIRRVELAPPWPVALDFTTEGNGAHFLRSGWSYLDSSGVWSIGSRSELALPVRGGVGGTFHIRLAGEVFHPPRTLKVTARLGDQVRTHEAEIDRSGAGLELDILGLNTPELEKTLHLVVEIGNAPSPKEAGLSGDVRRLGLFLRRISFSADNRGEGF